MAGTGGTKAPGGSEMCLPGIGRSERQGEVQWEGGLQGVSGQWGRDLVCV